MFPRFVLVFTVDLFSFFSLGSSNDPNVFHQRTTLSKVLLRSLSRGSPALISFTISEIGGSRAHTDHQKKWVESSRILTLTKVSLDQELLSPSEIHDLSGFILDKTFAGNSPKRMEICKILIANTCESYCRV